MNCLLSETIYHRTKLASENLLSIEMKKIQIFMNNRVCLGPSVLGIIKLVISMSFDMIK